MRRRAGFTLIELLVAIALIVMILAVLAEAFSVGLDSFGRLKAIGDMSDRLRVATHLIREDLAANHFEADIRLSDSGFGGTVRPREGFFYVKHFADSVVDEGTADNTKSWRSPKVDPTTKDASSHVLYMTVRRKGNQDKQFFSATVPDGCQLLQLADKTSPFPETTPNSLKAILPPDARMQDPAKVMYRSQWAEVAYFLRPLPTNDRLTALGTQLYALHRVTRVLVSPENKRLARLPRSQAALFYGMSFYPPAPSGADFTFGTPSDVVYPSSPGYSTRRSFDFDKAGVINEPTDPAAQHLPGASDPLGISDIRFLLLPDVISFNVQLIRQSTPLNFGYPFDRNGTDFLDLRAAGFGTGIYDSTSGGGLIAIRITLRVWDVRSHQTRQISIVQDL